MTVQSPDPRFRSGARGDGRKPASAAGRDRSSVLHAMGNVAREKFLPPQTRPLAYVDRAVLMGDGRFLPAPAVLGSAADANDARGGQRALVVGAGTGYSADDPRCDGSVRRCARKSASWPARPVARGRGRRRAARGRAGRRALPIDQILIDGAVEYIPDAIVDQLADGGRLGTASIDRGITRLIVGRKAGGAFGYLSLSDAGVPALPGFTRPKAFTF